MADTKKTFRVIIAGSRSFNDYELLKVRCNEILQDFQKEYNIIIVSGTASGADRLGERYANERGYQVERNPADWKRFSLSAGIIRNKQMADHADMLIAFWDGISRGTANMIRTAQKGGLSVRIIPFTNYKHLQYLSLSSAANQQNDLLQHSFQ